MSFDQEYKYLDTCQQDCIGLKDPSKKNPQVCYPRQWGAKAPPTATAPITNNWLRKPRNSRKAKKNPEMGPLDHGVEDSQELLLFPGAKCRRDGEDSQMLQAKDSKDSKGMQLKQQNINMIV